MGQVTFSPQLQQVSQTINAWNLLEKKAKGLQTSPRLIHRALLKANLPPASRGLALKTIQQNLQESYKTYCGVKGSDKVLRASSMEKFEEAIASARNNSKEKTRGRYI
jgi:hypothetical protein